MHFNDPARKIYKTERNLYVKQFISIYSHTDRDSPQLK